MPSTEIRIGTRGSPLALAQAREVRRRLAHALSLEESGILIVPIRTSGDRITDRPLLEAGGKGLFTKEIDEALLAGDIDMAVHSAKDMPTALPGGIVIAATLPREDVRDALLSPKVASLADLPQGAVLGTSSLRRKAMALRLRPDLRIVDLRGNVGTRIRKLDEGVADATVLAMAGLNRLGLAGRASGVLDIDRWLPAVAQGTIAIATRAQDAQNLDRVLRIDDRETSIALRAERAFLAVLDGSCRTPIGGLARLDADVLTIRGIIIKPDGTEAHEAAVRGGIEDAERLGAELGASLRRAGGPDFFEG
ncbi:MAG TPA: hydroxymethylbilane synthase [Bauldia sp.]|nr:hydroxymethylbilane synthase [Bauldia sp.]